MIDLRFIKRVDRSPKRQGKRQAVRMILQHRRLDLLALLNTGEERWSDWEDVPVEEEQTP